VSLISSDTSPWQPVRSHKWALTAKRRVRKADSEASPDAPNQRPLAESNDAVDAAAQLLVESADSLPSFFEAPPANPGTSASSPVEEVDANTQGMVAQMEANEGAVSDPFEQSMLDDIAEFKRTRNVDPVEDDKNAQLKKVVTVLGTVLSYNFVIIIGFFLWFLTGCIGKFAFEVRFARFTPVMSVDLAAFSLLTCGTCECLV